MIVRWRDGSGLCEGGGDGQRIRDGPMGIWEADVMGPNPIRINDLVKTDVLLTFSLEDILVLLHLFKDVPEDYRELVINLQAGILFIFVPL